MTDLFISFFNMSITASWLVLAVVVLRFLLKKAPKWINAVLWAFVGFRLICPFSFESVLSLIPSTDTVPHDIIYSQSPTIHSGIPSLNSVVNPVISESFAPDVTNSVNPLQVVLFVTVIVWLIGIFAMLVYSAVSFIRLSRKVREGVVLKDNIWLCDRIDTPFILGLFRPRIFLPSGMAESDMEYVIAHEKAHLRRRDHWWKPLGFILLTVYWFNPVMWVAYVLLCRDIELACDEKVIKEMGTDARKPYSEALINCSVSRRTISACPLAFGETGVKDRIKSVLSYKKPTLWIIIIAVISCIVVAVCFLTNPKSDLKKTNPELDYAVSQAILEINSSGDLYNTECVAEGHIIYGVEEEGENVTVYLQEEFAGFGFKNGYFMEQTGSVTPAVYTFIKKDDDYVLSDYDYPMDGEKYYDSIKEMFPSEYVYRAFNVSEKDYADLWAQCVAYAEDYLIRIGRDAEVRDYSEVPHVLLTDLGVSVEVSNKITENESFYKYDYDIGYYETLEDGVRFVYRTDYDKDRGVIIYTTEVYKTGDIIEKIEIDGQTGEILLKENNDVILPEPETDYYGNKYDYLDKLDYKTAGKIIKEMPDKYSITAVHYPKEGESEAPMLVKEVSCSEAAYYLSHVNWKRSQSPMNPLLSSGSVEFVIDEYYTVTIYARQSGSVFAYAVVNYEYETRYYHASYGDYNDAVTMLHPPENNFETTVEWVYSPAMSSIRNSFLAVKLGFDSEYTHTVTSCSNGEMFNVDADGQPYGSTLTFKKDETIYWRPDKSVFNQEDYEAEVHFTVYKNKEQVCYGSLLITCVEKAALLTFDVILQDSSGLSIVGHDNGVYITEYFDGSDADSYDSADKLDYKTAGRMVSGIHENYAVQAIHYPASGEFESGILLGEAYGYDLGIYLRDADWNRSLPPVEELSSPGSVEFVIDEEYRVNVYERKKGSLFAYAVVRYGDEERYYHVSYDDYKNAVALLHPPATVDEPVEGFHSYSYITENDSAYISLNPTTKTVFFSLSRLSDFVINGTYQDYTDKLLIIADNKEYKYMFRKSGENLIFVADESTPVPEYKYKTDGEAELCIPDGAVFTHSGFERYYIDKVLWDIDNDGTEEHCVLTYGPTSGLFTVTFSAYENGHLEYFNIFNSYVSDIQFGWDENGTLEVRGTLPRYGADPIDVYYDVIIKDGNIVLDSNIVFGTGDSTMPYWGEQGLSSPYAGS